MSASTPPTSAWSDPLDELNAADTLAVERFITFKVNQLSTAFERQWTRFAREQAGVSLSEWRILAMLNSGPSTFARLVEATGINKALVSRSAHGLQAQRLISVSETPGDARSITLVMTAKGQKLFSEVEPVALKRQRLLLSALSASERRAFYGAVDKLRAAAAAWDSAQP